METPSETLCYQPLQLELDLWRPADSIHGLVVHAHGGGFVHGSRDDRIARHYGPRLSQLGIAFASISYRKGGKPAEAFDPSQQARIDEAAAQSSVFFPNVRPALFQAALYRAAADYSNAVQFLLSKADMGVLPWVALGNSSGGLAAISVAHGLAHLDRPAGLPAPVKAIGIACTVPQPWMLQPDGPAISLLCARGDQVFPRDQIDILDSYVQSNGLPVKIQRIPYGQHPRPVREILPNAQGNEGPWAEWLLTEISDAFDAVRRA